LQLDRAGRSKRETVEVIALSWPVALVLGIGVPGLGVATGAANGKPKLYLAAGLILVAALSGWVAWLRGSKTGGYKRTSQRFARLMAGAGQPVVIALGDLAVSPSGQGPDDPAVVTLRHQIISTLRLQCGTTHTDDKRAAIYEFNGTRDLHRTAWAGRRAAPRAKFLESDVPHGRNVVEFAASTQGDIDRVSDVDRGTPTPRGVVARGASYKSYLSASISVAGRSWGMLTVDSPEVAAFRETDEGTISLLAGVLAAGLAHAGVSSQAPVRVSETKE
jgi:putative methionine-R-sulfoxide reductase with GAF domain